MVTHLHFGATVVLALATVHAQAPAGRGVKWQIVADVPLPGRAARFDYQSLDAITRRLWIAHMGADEVLAFDVHTRHVVSRVPTMTRVTGVLVAPTLQRVFTALSGSHEAAFDISGDLLASLPSYRAPHAHSVAVDPATGLVYVPLEDVRGRPILRILRLE